MESVALMSLRQRVKRRISHIDFVAGMVKIDERPSYYPEGTPLEVKLAFAGFERDLQDLLEHHVGKLERAQEILDQM